MFIPDPDLWFLPIPDPGVKKALDTGSGSTILNPGLRRNSLILKTLAKYLAILPLKYKAFQHKIVPPAFCPIFEILNYWMCIRPEEGSIAHD